MKKSFERIISLVGIENFEKILNSKVAIVGLGGVGGASATCLARCGVGNLVIVDFDKVAPSNINRQFVASINTIDQNKTDVLSKQLKEINPDLNITVLNEKFNEESSLFEYEFDYLIDCIDDVNNKLLLIKTCQEKGINFISSMGTAKKMDLKKLVITNLSKTTYDPLAKVVRKKAKELGLKDFKVLSSTEEIINIDSLGSYMPVVTTAGLMLADYIIKEIIK